MVECLQEKEGGWKGEKRLIESAVSMCALGLML